MQERMNKRKSPGQRKLAKFEAEKKRLREEAQRMKLLEQKKKEDKKRKKEEAKRRREEELAKLKAYQKKLNEPQNIISNIDNDTPKGVAALLTDTPFDHGVRDVETDFAKYMDRVTENNANGVDTGNIDSTGKPIVRSNSVQVDDETGVIHDDDMDTDDEYERYQMKKMQQQQINSNNNDNNDDNDASNDGNNNSNVNDEVNDDVNGDGNGNVDGDGSGQKPGLYIEETKVKYIDSNKISCITDNDEVIQDSNEVINDENNDNNNDNNGNINDINDETNNNDNNNDSNITQNDINVDDQHLKLALEPQKSTNSEVTSDYEVSPQPSPQALSVMENDTNIIQQKRGSKNIRLVSKKKKKKYKHYTELDKPYYKGLISIAHIKKERDDIRQIQVLNLKIGCKIELKEKSLRGIIKYIGAVHFTHGIVIGIEIAGNTPGKNSGHLDKIMYFKCKKNGGLFIRVQAIAKVLDYPKSKKSRASKDIRNKKSKKNKHNNNNLNDIDENKENIIGTDYDIMKYQTNEINLDGCTNKDRKRLERLHLEIGDVVELDKNRRGILHYFGSVHFTDNVVFGIELLDDAKGKTNGTVDGQEYFSCNDKKGIFMDPSKIRRKGKLVLAIEQW